jgi:uncharacterized membrane protein
MHEVELILEWLAVAIDLVGALIMIWAFVTSVVGLLRGSIIGGDAHSRIRNLQVVRCGLGVKLVFALGLMIISDLLHTIISRSVDDLILVGGLVVIRTVIGYFLNREIQEVGAELTQEANSG